MSKVNIIACQNHQKRKAHRYCEECKEFICNSCAFKEKHSQHLQKIKSLSDIIKSFLPGINNLNKSSLSKYIELFQFIINYNSSFMPFDLNNIMNQINKAFDTYINKIVDLKIKFKILISQKFELINDIFEENEKKILETQSKIISIVNNEDFQYFEKMNTCLEQIRSNKNDNNMMEFVEQYNTLIKQAFDDDNDFNMKYNLYIAQKQLEKNNIELKENILDKLIQPWIKDGIKNIENIYQKINNQNNTDLENLKKKFENLVKNPKKKYIEDEEKDDDEIIEVKNPDVIKNDVKNDCNPIKASMKMNTPLIKEMNKKIIKEEPKKLSNEPPKMTKIELLNIEFEPPEIETCELTKKELEEMNDEFDDEYENEFLQIEEDGDDGLLLAEVIDGNDSEEATVNLEEFFINNMDDKLDIQYYEGIKFEGENEGEGLNDEALVEGIEEDNKEEEIPKQILQEDEIKKEFRNESPKKMKTNAESPRKTIGKLNTNIANKIQNANETPGKSPKKVRKENNNDLGQFIEEKNEQQEENQINGNEEIKAETPPGKDKLMILCNIAKSGGRNRNNFQTLFNELTWEQKGKVEIMAVDQKKSTLHIYNNLSNKIEEIKTIIQFPLQLSYINLPPYLYISGGKVNGKDSTSLIRIKRKGNSTFANEEIAQLKQGRSNHCTIYVQNLNSLIFISGSRTKSCEKYSLTKGKMENFPALKVSRERCCACVINEKYLYVFFGFDRSKNKFETSLERISINDAMSWESINLTGNQNILKKQNFACIPFCKDNKKGVIIVGGINSLRNETKETVFIDLDSNKGEIFSQLPYSSSFTNSFFTSFDKYSCGNEMINISNEFNVVKFNLDNNGFYGL